MVVLKFSEIKGKGTNDREFGRVVKSEDIHRSLGTCAMVDCEFAVKVGDE